ncbi:MAG: hypothetical protein EZS28_002475 [Streblomastix strix]|uniref:Nuclear cap-binding protein subunit 2 n=1 Tax=Streblomastix strix TaxID=222440 RepID=A0A5J4X451_9EUKA|nr:MAG: hypothetical protein EZS28_002475 [Streblomastix strix]
MQQFLLDYGKIIRVDIDVGSTKDRQFGRGRTGRQVRDDQREEYDADRGGKGRAQVFEDGLTSGLPQKRRYNGERNKDGFEQGNNWKEKSGYQGSYNSRYKQNFI